MERLSKLLERGLRQTEPLWPPVRFAHAWVLRTARLLANEEGLSVWDLRRAYRALLAEISPQRQTHSTTLSSAATQFLKLTKRATGRGCSPAYKTIDLPRTNNRP